MAAMWGEFFNRIRRSRIFSVLSARWAGRRPSIRPASLAAAGDMARASGQRQEAPTLYGRAIDGFLVAAVTRARAAEQAASSLLELAAATANPAIRQAIADALRHIGRPDYADGVERGTAAAAAASTWDPAMRAALTHPGDVDLAALTPS